MATHLGNLFYPFDSLTNSKSQRRNGATVVMVPGSNSGSGSDSNKWKGLSFNGFLNHMAYNIVEVVIFGVIIPTIFFIFFFDYEKYEKYLSPALKEYLEKIKDYQPTEEEERMFKGIEDSAIANIMTSIDEFKTKYLN